MAGAYFHIPFCRSLCSYCDFPRTMELSLMEGVVDAMNNEIDQREGFLTDRNISTIYFGGGTPSLLPVSAIEGLVERLSRYFDLSGVSEFTVEVNPDDITPTYVEQLLRAGVNRLSMGMQSFDDDCLRFMNRRHSSKQAVEAISLAQRAGFDNISGDLIFGVPGYGGDSLHRSVDTMLSLGIQHISAYHLTIEPDTHFGRLQSKGDLTPIEDGCSEQEFLYVHDQLSSSGYEHYEVSNYAVSGRRAQHNASYWSGAQYLGIGAGAHSYNGDVRWWNSPSAVSYLKGEGAESESLTAMDRRNESVMTGLRTSDGVDLERFRQSHSQGDLERLLSKAEGLIVAGDLVLSERSLAIPAKRFMISDAIISQLFEVE